MGNMIDYMRWRGDITFEERAFNEVDNLIFAELSYVDLGEIIDKSEIITIKRAAKRYFSIRAAKRIKPQREAIALKAMAECSRYKNISLFKVITRKDDMTQFSAFCAKLPDETVIVVFRGTDDAIVGWKEDFEISYRITLAQELSVKYLKYIIKEHSNPLRIIGHSKGGNMAVYAAMMLPERMQTQILEIYNDDGPGICREFCYPRGLKLIENKIKRYIPEFCFIGKLFEQKIPAVIVECNTKGVWQHDPLTWEISGDRFVCTKELTHECVVLNSVLRQWIESASLEEREDFTENFFGAIEACGATNISEIPESGIKGLGNIFSAIWKTNDETKEVIGRLIAMITAQLKPGNKR